MLLKSFSTCVQVYRKYLITAANNVCIPHKFTPLRSFSHCSVVSKHKVYAHSIPSEITCRKCQVQRNYSRGLLDGDTSHSQNAQKERELAHLATLFPNPRVTLNELATKSPDSVFDIQYKQASVAPKGTRKKTIHNDWTCTYAFVWPQKIKFESTAKSKRQAAEKAATQALHWLHINKRIDSKGYPIFDKTVLDELNNSLQEPIKAGISENSMERINRIWEDYEAGIRDIYTATFEAAAQRAIRTPTVLTKDSTIEEEDELPEHTEQSDEIYNVSELKIPVHPVYGRPVSPPTETALDRRKRQLMKRFQVYDEERTQLPIDEYSLELQELRAEGKLPKIIQEDILQILAPLPGIILVTFLSEIRGRKLVFILLFALSLLSGILSYASYEQPWAMMGNFIVATLRGGVLPITPVAICEYCSPKHRFAYLMGNEVAKVVGARATNIFYSAGFISREATYLSLCEAIIALVCLGSVFWWPESPYWLARQGKYEESKASLLRLRMGGPGAHDELRAMETSRRRPTPKLFLLALFISIITMTIAECASSCLQFLFHLNWDSHDFIPRLTRSIISDCVTLVVSLVIVLVSYKVKRKVIYLIIALTSLIVLYIAIIWAYSVAEQGSNQLMLYIVLFICGIILEQGPIHLTLALSIEWIPQKYNTFISCISSLYFTASTYIFSYLPLNYHGNFNPYGFLFLFATLALLGLVVLYCLLPETRGKNLLEIENQYLSKLYGESRGPEPIMLESVRL